MTKLSGLPYSYELGSGADGLTALSESIGFTGEDGTTIWTGDGIYLLDTNKGYQYYHARFSDLKEGMGLQEGRE